MHRIFDALVTNAIIKFMNSVSIRSYYTGRCLFFFLPSSIQDLFIGVIHFDDPKVVKLLTGGKDGLMGQLCNNDSSFLRWKPIYPAIFRFFSDTVIHLQTLLTDSSIYVHTPSIAVVFFLLSCMTCALFYPFISIQWPENIFLPNFDHGAAFFFQNLWANFWMST